MINSIQLNGSIAARPIVLATTCLGNNRKWITIHFKEQRNGYLVDAVPVSLTTKNTIHIFTYIYGMVAQTTVNLEPIFAPYTGYIY